MTNLAPLLQRNQTFAATAEHANLTPIHRLRLFVITCVDPRVDPARFLGLELGEALVLRNAGGRVNAEAVEEVALIATMSEAVLGDQAPPFEVAVLHHTRCGTALLADEAFRSRYARRIGADPERFGDVAVTDPDTTVRADVQRLRASPALPSTVSVSGHVYDVETGLVRTVVPVRGGHA